MASALRDLGSEHVMVVHGLDGLDEISISAKTTVCELANGKLTHYELTRQPSGMRTIQWLTCALTMPKNLLP